MSIYLLYGLPCCFDTLYPSKPCQVWPCKNNQGELTAWVDMPMSDKYGCIDIDERRAIPYIKVTKYRKNAMKTGTYTQVSHDYNFYDELCRIKDDINSVKASFRLSSQDQDAEED